MKLLVNLGDGRTVCMAAIEVATRLATERRTQANACLERILSPSPKEQASGGRHVEGLVAWSV